MIRLAPRPVDPHEMTQHCDNNINVCLDAIAIQTLDGSVFIWKTISEA